MRFGACKRDSDRLMAEPATLHGHVERFLNEQRQYRDWTIEYVACAPSVDHMQRTVLNERGLLVQDAKVSMGLCARRS